MGSKVRKANSAYYPEVECGYIKYSGVKYLYKEGLKKTKVATTAISLMISAVPGCGWGAFSSFLGIILWRIFSFREGGS